MEYDMQCSCNAVLHIQAKQDETVVWLIIQRFLDAHVKCGYVTPIKKELDAPLKTLDVPIGDMPLEE